MIESNYMSEIIGVCVGKIFVVKNMPSGNHAYLLTIVKIECGNWKSWKH